MDFGDLVAPGGRGTGVAEQPAIRRPRGFVPLRPTYTPRTQRSAGFTLIEAMVTVTIVGVMAASMVPAVSSMIAEHRQHRAAVDVMLAARHARSEAVFGNHASGLYFDDAGDGARIVTVTGLTSRCGRGDNVSYPAEQLTGIAIPRGWQVLFGSVPIDMRRYSFGGQGTEARLLVNGAQTDIAFLCWEPRGGFFAGPAPAAMFEVDAVTLPLMFFNRYDADSNEIGTERQLVFSVTGTPRLR